MTCCWWSAEMVRKILVANRGEIAVRVMRACRELGIPSRSPSSPKPTREALFVKLADEAFLIGPAPASQSYLDIDKIVDTAEQCGADAIHPGYGFLAENPSFADACESRGIKFIGPSSRVLALVGDKAAARREMISAGVPVVPGSEECVSDPERAASHRTADRLPGHHQAVRRRGWHRDDHRRRRGRAARGA